MTTRFGDIVPGKTVMGSYLIVRLIDRGGMGEVWEGWLIPAVELGNLVLRGERKDLRSRIGGITSPGELTPQERDRVREWIREETEKFIASPPQSQDYRKMDSWVSPHRRLFADYRRAIKILHPEVAQDEQRVKRFREEIEILSRLNHPNIIKVVESGTWGPHPYAAMEYVEAAPLEKAQLSIPGTVMVIRKALEGLLHAHEQGVLHLDIKPANILVSQDLTQVKLSDFGIARALDADSQGRIIGSTTIVGTAFYLDPERARGEALTEESDVYSLGATLYRLLTGTPPATASAPMKVVAKIESPKDPPWVRELNPRVSRALEDVVMMMLSKNRRTRLNTRETAALLKRLDDSNGLVEQETSRTQEQLDRQKVRRQKREVRRLRTAIMNEPGVPSARLLGEFYGACGALADLQPRDTPAGINTRIDYYTLALDVHRNRVMRDGGGPAKAVEDQVQLLGKRCELEYRRLVRLNIHRILRPQASSRLRRLAVIAALGIVAILAGFYTRGSFLADMRFDQTVREAERALESDDPAVAEAALVRAREAAAELSPDPDREKRLSRIETRVDEQKRISAALQRCTVLWKHLKERDHLRAASELAAIREILSGIKGSAAPPANSRHAEVRHEVETAAAILKPFDADIRVFTGLMEAHAGIRKETQALNTEHREGRPLEPDAIGRLTASLDALQAKLRNPDLVRPEAIGRSYAVQMERVRETGEILESLARRQEAEFVREMEETLRRFEALFPNPSPDAPTTADRLVEGGVLLRTGLELLAGMVAETDARKTFREKLARLSLRHRNAERLLVERALKRDIKELDRLTSAYRNAGLEERAKGVQRLRPDGRPQ